MNQDELRYIIESNMSLSGASSGDLQEAIKEAWLKMEHLHKPKTPEWEPVRTFMLNSMPEKFGKIEPNTPLYELVTAVAQALHQTNVTLLAEMNDHKVEVREFFDPAEKIKKEIVEKSTKIVHTQMEIIRDDFNKNLRKMVKEELEALFKNKSAAETSEFLTALENL